MNKYIILINKDHAFKDENNFTLINAHSSYCGKYKIEKETYEHFLLLQKFAMDNGYNIDIESAYRSFNDQKTLFKEIKLKKGLQHTLKYVAKPGYSEHQSGLAIDICQFKNEEWLVEFDMDKNLLEFIEDNAFMYGFILRYPKKKVHITGYEYEPWHLRYIGLSLAHKLNKSKITLEEYYLTSL